MKSFYITLVIFFLLICLGVANYIYIGRVYDQTVSFIDQISDDPSEENSKIIEELQKYWEKESTFMGTSISYSTIDKVSDIIDNLEVYNSERDKTSLKNSKKMLENAIYEIKCLEEFSMRNIF